MRLSILSTTAIVIAESLGGYAYPTVIQDYSMMRLVARGQTDSGIWPRSTTSTSLTGIPAQEGGERITRSNAKGLAESPRIQHILAKRTNGKARSKAGNPEPAGAQGGVKKSTRNQRQPSPDNSPMGKGGRASSTSSEDVPRGRGRPTAPTSRSPAGKAETPKDVSQQPPPFKSAARLAMEGFSAPTGHAKVTSVTEGHDAQTTLQHNPNNHDGPWTKGTAGRSTQHASGKLAAGIHHTSANRGSISVQASHSIDFGIKAHPDGQGGRVDWKVPGNWGRNAYEVAPGQEWANRFHNDDKAGQPPLVMDIRHSGGSAWAVGRNKADKDREKTGYLHEPNV